MTKPKIGLLLGTRGMVMRAQREGAPMSANGILTLAERAEAPRFPSHPPQVHGDVPATCSLL